MFKHVIRLSLLFFQVQEQWRARAINLSTPHPKVHAFWISVLMHWIFFSYKVLFIWTKYAWKAKVFDKVCLSVIWLKQVIWSLGEDNRVCKLFIFSLSTELINFAKDYGWADAFTEDKCTSGVTLLSFQKKKKKKSQSLQTRLVQPMKYSAFLPANITNLDVGFLSPDYINIS